jgi:7-cyano-7-deazaguanine synthase
MNAVNCVLALSGGMDSGTMLAYCLSQYNSVLAIGFNYGSKHNQYELAMAQALCVHYNVEYIQIDLRPVGEHLESHLLQGGGGIPEGHHEGENMKLTVVPGRNLMFLSILAALAESRGAGYVAAGIHSGDHAIYPDCRPMFLMHAGNVIAASTDNKVKLICPFIHWDKTKILHWGLARRFPYHLTRTCYKDTMLSCGKCGSCTERLEAFKNEGVDDPIFYLRPNPIYGYCPACGSEGVFRERRLDGNDKCKNGHTYPSRTALVNKRSE